MFIYFLAGVGQKTEPVSEDLTEDMLEEDVTVYITETDSISVLDIPSVSVSAESDDAPEVLWVFSFKQTF